MDLRVYPWPTGRSLSNVSGQFSKESSKESTKNFQKQSRIQQGTQKWLWHGGNQTSFHPPLLDVDGRHRQEAAAVSVFAAAREQKVAPGAPSSAS